VTITNTGPTTISDVVVILEIKSDIYGPEIERSPDAGSRLLRLAQAADEIPGSPFTRVVYTAEMIHPGVSLRLHDVVVLPGSSRVVSQTTAVAKDGVPLTIRSSFTYGFPVKVNVMARDVPATTCELSILSFDLKDPEVTHVIHGTYPKVNLEVADEARLAAVMIVRKPERAPEVPSEFSKYFFRARLSAARCFSALSLKNVGYVRQPEQGLAASL
jgi:hypothetical protein